MGAGETGCECVHWIEPAQNRVQKWASVISVVKFRLPKTYGISGPPAQLSPFDGW